MCQFQVDSKVIQLHIHISSNSFPIYVIVAPPTSKLNLEYVFPFNVLSYMYGSHQVYSQNIPPPMISSAMTGNSQLSWHT